MKELLKALRTAEEKANEIGKNLQNHSKRHQIQKT